jgi:hypothetical protein
MSFTIRDVLWLMVVVGLACGWWMERRSLLSKLERLESSYQQTGIEMDYLLRRFDELEPGFRQNPHWTLDDVRAFGQAK